MPSNSEVLLINPPSGIFYGLGPNFAPFGLFSLAEVLRQKDIRTTILNANYFPNYYAQKPEKYQHPKIYYYAEDYKNQIWEQVLNFIKEVSPKLIGFSAHDLAVGGIKYLSKEIKKQDPQLTIAVGGATPSSEPAIFNNTLEIDYLLAGEGEETIVELAKMLKLGTFKNERQELKPSDIPGLYYRQNNIFTMTTPRASLKNLDSLPFPNRKYFWLDYDTNKIIKDVQLNGLATSRGCIRACKFCAAKTIWPGPIRYRSIKKVVKEVAQLRKEHGYNFQHFSIFDDDFLAKPERIFEFCQLLNNLKDDYRFRCYGRVNNLQDETVLETLLQSGCQEIWVGVESGSQKVLDSMGKGITLEQIKKVDNLFHLYDFPWMAFIILGTPHEEENDILATLKMLKNGYFPSIQPFTFQPYTGTSFFQLLKEQGKVIYEDIIKGHQTLPQYFSQKVAKKRFFELFEQLKELAEKRHQAWVDNFYLSKEQTKKALDLEKETINFLKDNPERFLVIGPERQLRWMAALNHYKNIGANMDFCDLKSKKIISTRFGCFKPPSFLENKNWDKLLIIAPHEKQAEFNHWAQNNFKSLPIININDFYQNLNADLFWRPVSEICRENQNKTY